MEITPISLGVVMATIITGHKASVDKGKVLSLAKMSQRLENVNCLNELRPRQIRNAVHN